MRSDASARRSSIGKLSAASRHAGERQLDCPLLAQSTSSIHGVVLLRCSDSTSLWVAGIQKGIASPAFRLSPYAKSFSAAWCPAGLSG